MWGAFRECRPISGPETVSFSGPARSSTELKVLDRAARYQGQNPVPEVDPVFVALLRCVPRLFGEGGCHHLLLFAMSPVFVKSLFHCKEHEHKEPT